MKDILFCLRAIIVSKMLILFKFIWQPCRYRLGFLLSPDTPRKTMEKIVYIRANLSDSCHLQHCAMKELHIILLQVAIFFYYFLNIFTNVKSFYKNPKKTMANFIQCVDESWWHRDLILLCENKFLAFKLKLKILLKIILLIFYYK